MSSVNKTIMVFLISLAGFVITGCQSTTVIVGKDPSIDLSAITRVAIVPFVNHSRDRLAGEKVTAVFLSTMVRTTSVEIVDPGEMLDALGEYAALKEKLSPLLVKKIGKKVNAQALIFGSVEEYAQEKFGRSILPVIAISVRMLDVETGKVLWVATASDSGQSRVPIINIGEIRTRTALTAKVIRKLISRVYSQ